MSTNPFDDDYDPDLIPRSARMKNPFDLDDDDSPISAAVRNEISRQASGLFYASLGDDSRSDSVDAAVKAIFDDIESYDSTQPLFLFHPPSDSAAKKPKGSGIARSKTVANSKTLTPEWKPARAASAKVILSRRQSSRLYLSRGGAAGASAASAALSIPPDRDPAENPLFRPASSRSLSARCGALAAGESLPSGISRSKSSNLVAGLVRSRSAALAPGDVPPVTEEEEIARMKAIADLIETKFRKHVIATECEDGYFCQCEKGCEKDAKLYADRYGRLGNRYYISPGFYDPQHLVDLFIDAYDEEKRMKDESH